ncbi:MAG TPA: major capsid protein [Sedimentisphaerales bacterium]|nr:major capsid protein [Sedimentisphaerales bacterium]
MLDIFRVNPNSCIELTAAINRAKVTPQRIGELGLFESKGVRTVDIGIEEKDSILSLIPTSARGTPPIVGTPAKRKLRFFRAPHLSKFDTVMADEVQGIRVFGTENELQTVDQVVVEKIREMRRSHEATVEFHRLGAIQGIVLDADGTTVVHNLWEEFEVTPDVVEFDFTAATPPIKTSCMTVKRTIERNLGGQPYNHIHCFCNSTWFDLLTNEAGVQAAYARWLDGAALRNDMRKGFVYAGIVFEEYPGSIGTTAFIPTVAAGSPGNAFFFPVGLPGLFKTYFAPADFNETANSLGIEFYGKSEVLPMGKGIIIETQSNPLCVCLLPKVLVRGQYV